MKTEPSEFSFADLEKQKRVTWDGVRNSLAQMHLRSMQAGDLALIYHSGSQKAVVGIAEICSDPFADPKTGSTKFVAVEVRPTARLGTPVPLAAVKAHPAFARFGLVRMARLSVMPVPPELWNVLLAMAT